MQHTVLILSTNKDGLFIAFDLSFLWSEKSTTPTAGLNLGCEECPTLRRAFLSASEKMTPVFWYNNCAYCKLYYFTGSERCRHEAYTKQQLGVSAVGSVWIMHDEDLELVLCTEYSDVLNLWLPSWLAELFLAALSYATFVLLIQRAVVWADLQSTTPSASCLWWS